MNVNHLEDISEIQIIKGNKSELEVNSQLDLGWELINILNVKDQLTFILGKREDEENTNPGDNS